jgi:hypothetical protein
MSRHTCQIRIWQSGQLATNPPLLPPLPNIVPPPFQRRPHSILLPPLPWRCRVTLTTNPPSLRDRLRSLLVAGEGRAQWILIPHHHTPHGRGGGQFEHTILAGRRLSFSQAIARHWCAYVHLGLTRLQGVQPYERIVIFFQISSDEIRWIVSMCIDCFVHYGYQWLILLPWIYGYIVQWWSWQWEGPDDPHASSMFEWGAKMHRPRKFIDFLTMHQKNLDEGVHRPLRDNLIDHTWMLKQNR